MSFCRLFFPRFPRMWTEPRAMQWFSKTFRRSWQPQMFIMKSDIFRISSHLVISQFCELENYHFNAGWWFGTWILWLSISWECHHPNWRTPSFFRGVGLNHQVIGQSSNFKGKIAGKHHISGENGFRWIFSQQNQSKKECPRSKGWAVPGNLRRSEGVTDIVGSLCDFFAAARCQLGRHLMTPHDTSRDVQICSPECHNSECAIECATYRFKTALSPHWWI